MSRAAAILIVALIAGACGRDAKPSSSGKVSGSLHVFAAASLTEAFNDEKAMLSTNAPDPNVTYNFAGSQALAQKIMQAAPGAGFTSADQKNMTAPRATGPVDTPRVFARNQ